MFNFWVIVLFFISALFAGPKPMESITKYNVVLVHGAADSASGFISDCVDSVPEALFFLKQNQAAPTKKPWKLGGAAGMIGAYNKRENINYWLDSAIFEDFVYRNGTPFVLDTLGSPYIYIQRSFSNPAESPAHNGHEIGDRKWSGTNGCKNRRSLFEEAQEIRAGGQDALAIKRRGFPTAKYRDIPSRYILIGHSMGGVASREYVQGDFYNEDVDKVITLDSPHEGTGALNMLLDLQDDRYTSMYGTIEVATQLLAWNILATKLGAGNWVTPVTMAIFLSNWSEMASKMAIKGALGYEYKATDPLVSYIPKDASGIKGLKYRPYKDSLPMFRLLYSKNALTFTDPGDGPVNSIDLLVPDALTATLGNVQSQLYAETPYEVKWTNTVSSALFGAVAGVTVQNNGSSLVPEAYSYGRYLAMAEFHAKFRYTFVNSTVVA